MKTIVGDAAKATALEVIQYVTAALGAVHDEVFGDQDVFLFTSGIQRGRLSFHVDTYRGKITISMRHPERCTYTPWYPRGEVEPDLSIGVSIGRQPADVLADVKRRLLPEFARDYLKVEAKKAETLAYNQKHDDRIIRLGEALGVEPHRERVFTDGGSVRTGKPLSVAFNLRGVRMDVKRERSEITIELPTVEDEIKVAVLIRVLAFNKAETPKEIEAEGQPAEMPGTPSASIGC
jgi:hypothetical protein